MLKKKNRLFKNFKNHGYRFDDKARLDTFQIDCQQAVETAKLLYLTNLGGKVNDPITSQKFYWKIINSDLNCREQAMHFNHYFSQQCKSIINNSVLPILNFLTGKRIDHITIQNNASMTLIRTRSDGISGQMLLLCDNTVLSKYSGKV